MPNTTVENDPADSALDAPTTAHSVNADLSRKMAQRHDLGNIASQAVRRATAVNAVVDAGAANLVALIVFACILRGCKRHRPAFEALGANLAIHDVPSARWR